MFSIISGANLDKILFLPNSFTIFLSIFVPMAFLVVFCQFLTFRNMTKGRILLKICHSSIFRISALRSAVNSVFSDTNADARSALRFWCFCIFSSTVSLLMNL